MSKFAESRYKKPNRLAHDDASSWSGCSSERFLLRREGSRHLNRLRERLDPRVPPRKQDARVQALQPQRHAATQVIPSRACAGLRQKLKCLQRALATCRTPTPPLASIRAPQLCTSYCSAAALPHTHAHLGLRYAGCVGSW